MVGSIPILKLFPTFLLTIECLSYYFTLRRNTIEYMKITLFFVLVQTKLSVKKDDLLLVYGGGYLHGVSTVDGEVLWKKELASHGFAIFLN